MNILKKINKYLNEMDDDLPEEILDFIKDVLSQYGMDDEDTFDDVYDFAYEHKDLSIKNLKRKIEDFIADLR